MNIFRTTLYNCGRSSPHRFIWYQKPSLTLDNTPFIVHRTIYQTRSFVRSTGKRSDEVRSAC